MLIDTHCHLTYPGLLENQSAVLERAAAAGVSRCITIGTHPQDHPLVLQTLQHAAVFGAVGIHPHHAAEVDDTFAPALESLFLAQPKLLAVGECGLDYHYDTSPRQRQHDVFVAQLQLARKLHKPVILHVREAHSDALAIMNDFADLRVVVHCFTGTPVECRQWLDRGAYVGITGIVTYKNAPDVREDAKLIPADRLLVETDAPYLSPEPVRKVKINEPSHVAHVARYVAGLRGITLEELAETTTRNAATLFGTALVAS